MYQEVDNLIKQYDKIIIHRHKNPDMDAIGSQMGLYYLIKENFKDKQVYVVGDTNKYVSKPLDSIDEAVYEGSLVIILDVAVSHLVSDERYKLAKEILVIDHHQNDCDITTNHLYMDVTYSACAEYVTDIFRSLNYRFNDKVANYLYAGIVTDTGRFQWMKDPVKLFNISGFLVSQGANPTDIYNGLYVESLESRQMKTYFQSKYQYEDGLGILKNDKSIYDLYDVDTFSISRGMVNLASGIDEIKIWLSFTEDKTSNNIIGEFRSRQIPIVEIAKKYGGGGHLNACGATLKSWDEVNLMIKDYKKLLEENKNGN